jgi:hypothetical protein
MSKSTRLSGTVGHRCQNFRDDSLTVQTRLNRYIEAGRLPPLAKLELNGRGGDPPTVQAIKEFQRQVMAVPVTGRITGTYDDTFVSLGKTVKEEYVFGVVDDMIMKCLEMVPLGGIDTALWHTALMSLRSHMEHPRLTRYSMMTIVDFRRPRSRPRLWVMDLYEEKVLLHTFVAHGDGSGGEVPKWFNVGAKVSQVGAFVTTVRDQVIAGQTAKNKEKHVTGPAVRIQGLDESNRDTARRGIIFHGAHYVKSIGPSVANSWGCFATSWEDNARIVNHIHGGSFVYAYAGPEYLPAV